MLANIHHYSPPTPTLWKGRKDSLPKERFFQRIDCIDILSQSLPKDKQPVFLGFCSDEGIRRNLGRTGAKLGPDVLREQLGKLACHSHQSFLDVGNITCEDNHLEEAQQEFAKLIAYCHQEGHKTIAFGGGHEIAWAHFQGLTQHYPELGIINFDAHFDLRPTECGRSTSGTPFAQIRDYCHSKNLEFAYCCLGIQKGGNTQSLFERARDWNVRWLTSEEMNLHDNIWQKTFLDKFMSRHPYLYISICLDVFAECYAPGVSAPQGMGLSPWQVLPLLKYILQSGKVISLDIAELSPPLDHEQKTARLAAMLQAELLNLDQGL